MPKMFPYYGKNPCFINSAQAPPSVNSNPVLSGSAAPLQIPDGIDSVETNISYIQAYLRQNIGKYIKAEFLIGTNMFIDKEGVLIDVGINYFVIIEAETDDRLLCDMYSLKFVKFYE